MIELSDEVEAALAEMSESTAAMILTEALLRGLDFDFGPDDLPTAKLRDLTKEHPLDIADAAMAVFINGMASEVLGGTLPDLSVIEVVFV